MGVNCSSHGRLVPLQNLGSVTHSPMFIPLIGYIGGGAAMAVELSMFRGRSSNVKLPIRSNRAHSAHKIALELEEASRSLRQQGFAE